MITLPMLAAALVDALRAGGTSTKSKYSEVSRAAFCADESFDQGADCERHP
jgi:hypothetical protein